MSRTVMRARTTPLARGARPVHLAENGPVPTHYAGDRPLTAPTLSEEHPVLENFFSALLALIAVAILAFTVLVVKKLYQGQS
ncbi:hypothetical protein [Streptomyces sp. NPDC058595]|uniref:hypothetical protein n=1 Tax=Streptomyces sp. NPDC058595 TaxID=3346550 RepID=UPI0036590B17